MKVVMTLLVRDEADLIEAQLSFHLHAGVDLIIATDNRSQDGSTEVLERFAKEGYVHLIREESTAFRQREWVTRMARLAATDFAADWVVNADADEFWWPRGGDLHEVLAPIPRRYGLVRGLWRSFVPRPESDDFFAERMIVRATPTAPINDPASTFRPQSKVAHRADPTVVLGSGNHGVIGGSLVPLRGWYPIEVLHFPVRSLEQWERKNLTTLAGWREAPRGYGTAYHEKASAAHAEGRMREHYDSLVLDDESVERGLEQGSLVIDTRLRDALRVLRRSGQGCAFALPSDGVQVSLPRPTLVDDAAFAVDAAVLAEADTVRLERRLDSLEKRLTSVERRLPARVLGKLSSAASRMRRDS